MDVASDAYQPGSHDRLLDGTHVFVAGMAEVADAWTGRYPPDPGNRDLTRSTKGRSHSPALVLVEHDRRIHWRVDRRRFLGFPAT